MPVTASFDAVPQARNLIKQQIADDRRARQSRGKPLLSPPATGTAGSLASVAGGGEEKAASASGAKSHASSRSTCRLQVYSVRSIIGFLILKVSSPFKDIKHYSSQTVQYSTEHILCWSRFVFQMGKLFVPLCRPVLLCLKWLSLSPPLTPASLLSPSYR